MKDSIKKAKIKTINQNKKNKVRILKLSNNKNNKNNKKLNNKKNKDSSFKIKITDNNNNNIANEKDNNEEVDNEFLKKVGKSWKSINIFKPFYLKGYIEFIDEASFFTYFENKLYLINARNLYYRNEFNKEQTCNNDMNDLDISLFYEFNDEEILSIKYINSKNIVIVCTSNFLLRIIEINNIKKKNIQSINLNKTFAKKLVTNLNNENNEKKEDFLALINSQNNILVYDISSMSIINTFYNSNTIINDITFHKNKPVLYCACENNVIKTFDILIGK